MKQAKQYYQHKETKEIYFEGKDQKRRLNLINAKSGSEYFLPGYYDRDKVNDYFRRAEGAISDKWEVLEYRPDNFIKLSDGDNYVTRNANIYKVLRIEDGKIFAAENTKQTTKSGLSFYITGFWYHSGLNTINACGNYKRNDNYFSPNICYLSDLI